MGRFSDRRDSFRARLARGSYRAAEDLEGRPTAVDGSGDFHADRKSRNDARRLARSAERNASLYDGPMSQVLNFLLGDGTWPRPLAGGLKQPEQEALAKAWATDAATPRFDFRQRDPLSVKLRLFARSYLRDGDVAAVHDGHARALTVEADRLVDPPAVRGIKTTGGIAKAGDGSHASYWIAEYDSIGRLNPAHAKPYPADRVTFVAHRTRDSQVRGVPVQIAGLDDLDRLDSLNESEIRGSEAASLPLALLEPGPNADYSGGNGPIITESAAFLKLPKGWKPTPTNFQRPNLNVCEFTRLHLRILVMVLGCPLELLMLDLGTLNYAASRSLRNIAEDALGKWRREVLHPLLDRLWSEWCADRGIDVPPVEWQWPRLQIHDRNKEAEADRAEIDNKTSSRLRIVGPDRFKILQELHEEDVESDRLLIARIVAAQVLCVAANKADPSTKLHWSLVISAAGATSAPGAYIQGAKPVEPANGPPA